MPVKQLFIVRRGNAERFQALQETFGVAPISATVTWDRREADRRRRRQPARVPPAVRRRADRRGAEPSSWSALDFLVTGPPTGEHAAMDGPGAAQASANPVDGDLLVLRETSVNGPCSVSTVPGAAHVLLPSYEEAVAYAERLADRVGSSVWYTEDYDVFIAVRRGRGRTAVS